MRLSVKNRSLGPIATMVVLTAAIVVFAAVCITDIHVPLADAVEDACLAAAHTAGLVASGAGVMSMGVMLVASVAGASLVFMAMPSGLSSQRYTLALAQQANPLNGRLRI